MPMPVPRRQPARTESLCTLAVFLVLAGAFVTTVEARFPHWLDREYEVRREALSGRVAEAPEKPVLLVLGSSRVVTAFMPERLEPLTDAAGRDVLVFNYAHFGAGPRVNLMQYHRALRDGVRPTWLVVEVAPPFLAHDDMPYTEAALRDVPVILPYSNKPRLIGLAAKQRVAGAFRPRTALLRQVVPAFATMASGDMDPTILPLGGADHWARYDRPAPEQQKQFTELASRRFEARMKTYEVAPYTAGATRDLLERCRSDGVGVALVLTPEDSRFRSWYRPGAEDELWRFLNELRTDFGVPVIDARLWVPDDGFTDPHHLNRTGAELFTDRLGAEVLRPLVGGDGWVCTCP